MPLEYLRSCAEDDALFTMIVRSSDQNRIGSAKATYAKEDVFWHLETFPSLDIPSGAMNGLCAAGLQDPAAREPGGTAGSSPDRTLTSADKVMTDRTFHSRTMRFD